MIYIFIDYYIDKYILTRKIFILCLYVTKRDICARAKNCVCVCVCGLPFSEYACTYSYDVPP